MDRKYQVDWSTLKTLAANKHLKMHSVECENLTEVFLLENGKPTFWTWVYKVGEAGYDEATRTDWETNYLPSANGPAVAADSDGVPLASVTPRLGNELILASHNFCDPTSWYTTSDRVTDETLTDSGDGLTFTSANTFWIDMTHGKQWDEAALCADVGHGYAVVVTSDAVEMVEREMYAVSGGDYTVDYATGDVTFFSSQSGKTVVASYSRMVDSTFSIVPDTGKVIDVESAIARFHEDLTELSDFIYFQIWVYNPYDLPNKVLYKQTTYKTLDNFADEAEPGTKVNGITALRFRYATVRPLKASQGLEIRATLRNPTVPLAGSKAVATFYCTVQTE